MDARLLEILVCPVCKACRLAYAIKDDIPIMLEEEARQLAAEEE